MNLFSVTQLLQYGFWFFALLEFVLALYVLLLNFRHIANCYTSLSLLIVAFNSFAIGGMLRATDVTQATWPTYLLAATSPLVQVGVLLTSMALVKPAWLRGSKQWVGGVIWGLGLALPLLVVVDVNFGTQLWYVGLDATYAGGYLSLGKYATGLLSPIIFGMYFYFISLATIFFFLYVTVWDKALGKNKRRLVWLLGGLQLLSFIIQVGLKGVLILPVRTFILGGGIALVYIYIAFHQMISERHLQRGHVQFRLIAVVMVITLPIFVAMVFLFISWSQSKIEDGAATRLQLTNHAVTISTELWLRFNIGALQQLVNQPEIVSMDAAQQLEELTGLQKVYSHLYLISTTDLQGMNVARSDGVPLKDYSDRYWFQAARAAPDAEHPIFQTLIGRTSGKPALVASLPIQNAAGQTIGVGMFASDLNTVAQEVAAVSWGNTGIAYVVDENNRVVAHPDPAFSGELRDLSATAPLKALRSGTEGEFFFTTEEKVRWRSYLTELENGWGVIVQQQEAEILLPLRYLQRIVWGITVLMVFILAGLFFFALRQALTPITGLTEAAVAIAAGDLTCMVPVESGDEFGVLAQAFNQMTVQLHDLIGSLEQRVADRTASLARRSSYLAAAAQVARDAAAIRDLSQLLDQTVRLISERFGFYHAGIFLVDETGEYAVLQAASSAGGRRMLAQKHRLKVGEVGIVGYAAGAGEPRIALDVGQDAVFFGNLNLPDTRSEIALPLKSQERVIGVLDVQSIEPGAFTEEDVAVLQTLADQITVAISNAQLFQQVRESLETERRLSGELSIQAWRALLHARSGLEVRRNQQGLHLQRTEEAPESRGAEGLALPIEVRGQTIGVLNARRPAGGAPWTEEDQSWLEMFTEQLGTALESARLYEDAQRRATREQLVGEVSAHIRESLDMDTVLQTAAREISQLLGLAALDVRLKMADKS